MSSKDKTLQSDCTESFDWNVENEIHLFNAVIDFRPIGPHRHFRMSLIVEKFSKSVNKSIHPDVIWKHLYKMFDMDQLHDLESSMPVEKVDFMLPESEYSTLIQNKRDLSKSYKSSVPKIKLDIKDGVKTPTSSKKHSSIEKLNSSTSRRDSTSKDEKNSTSKSSSRTDDKRSAGQKGRPRKNSEVGAPPSIGRIVRPTRGSLKPDESTPTRGRSPGPSSKRRRTRTEAHE